MPQKTPAQFLADFFKMGASGGIILFIAAIVAIIFANTGLKDVYNLILTTPVAIQVGELNIAKPLLLWVNDGLMAIFFFLVGLELKREVVEGELSNPRNILLPGVGAIGGMVGPALVYFFFNQADDVALRGWAIPAATDIAFALGVLALLGSRVPVSVKIFLTSLAIFDDIGAIIIIALFYTAKISLTALIVVALCIPLLAFLNWRNVEAKSIYVIVGIVMWVAMLKSGVHATLAGVLLAMFIPMKSTKRENYSPLKALEHDLHSAVAFVILPIFAFANAGISLEGVGIDQLLHPVPLGIAIGLFVGKQIGIFCLCGLIIKLGWASFPKGMGWASLYGTAALCGIGFTMSLFIGSLAFDVVEPPKVFDERLGIVIGSVLSGLVGFFILRGALKKPA